MVRRVTIAGSPRERGEQYGELTRVEIERGIELYAEWFREFGGIDWSRATELASDHLRHLEDAKPDVAAELAGIATGSNRAVTEIVALNTRTEIAYASTFARASECTSLAVLPGASTDGHLYVGENWDWIEDALQNAVLLHVKLPSGLELLTFTEAGMLAKFGVNSAGIALCSNLLATEENGIGDAFHTLSREVLSSSTLLEALWSVTGSTRAGSGNYLIASAAGDVIDVEWSPRDFRVLFPEDGFITHANHFTQEPPGLRDRSKLLASISPGTYLRQRRAHELLGRASSDGTGIGLEDITDVLRDHRNLPEGICRHTGEAGRGRTVMGQTNLSVIFDLTEQTLHYTVGPPCSSEYRSAPFPWAQDGDRA